MLNVEALDDSMDRNAALLDRRSRLDREPGLQRADPGACGRDSTPREFLREVECAFWKEEPSLRDALFLFRSGDHREVYVVPNFISEGYFTQTVIPRELGVERPDRRKRSERPGLEILRAGREPSNDDGFAAAARAPKSRRMSIRRDQLLIVAHGTDLNDNSAVAAKRESGKNSRVRKVRRRC